jgi:hypothetical protein
VGLCAQCAACRLIYVHNGSLQWQATSPFIELGLAIAACRVHQASSVQLQAPRGSYSSPLSSTDPSFPIAT